MSKSKLPFDSKFVLTVKVVCCHAASMGKFRDILDTPDPFVKLVCENARSSSKFKTKTIMNDPDAVWNETFSFVLPNELYTANKEKEPLNDFSLKVFLYDEDLAAHDLIGKSTLDLNQYPRDVTNMITLDYNKSGKLDLEITLKMRTEPDFRYSLGFTKEEEEIVKKRKEIAFKAMTDVFGTDKAPLAPGETPTIAIIGSGGGYRAMTSFIAATEVFHKEKIMDMASYIMGLSGSGWFLISSLVYEALHNEQLFLKYKGQMRKAMRKNMTRLLLDLPHVVKFEKYLTSKTNEQQPYSFIDFYGFSLGRTYLKRNMKKTFSSMRPYVLSGRVPFPVITALHVEPQTNSDQFNVHTEMTPFEISFPNYGIHIPTESFGSEYYGGILVRKCPEQPVHFFKGMTGSAIGITFDEFRKECETDPEFTRELERRLNGRKFRKSFSQRPRKTLKSSGASNKAFTNIMTDSNENVEEEIKEDATTADQMEPRKTHKERRKSKVSTAQEKAKQKDRASKLFRRLLSDREFLLDRTAKVFNFAHELHEIHYCDLCDADTQHTSTEDCSRKHVDRCGNHLSFVDAAVSSNIPSNCALRRNVDVIIALDFSEYEADDQINHKQLFKTEKQAKDQGLKFPTIDRKKLAETPLDEVLVFKEDGCPTVIWITLSSKKFKETLKDQYITIDCCGKKKSEADFSVFGPESKYGTLKTKYTGEEFNKLNALVKYNISSNIELIKNEIQESILKKRTVVTTF